MKSTKIVIALLLFASAVTANAASLLNGLALEQQFNKDRYFVAVYSDQLADNTSALLDNNVSRSLQIRVIEDRLSARRLRNQWMESIAINNPSDTLTGQANNMVTFANLFKGRLMSGDHLSIDYAPDTGTTSVSLNDIMLGMIEDRDFFNTLLRAWIGPVPPSTEFRDSLISSGDVDSGLLATYESLQPGAARVAQVAAMLDEQEAAKETSSAAAAPVPAVKPKLAANIPPPTLAAISTAAVQKPTVEAAQPAAEEPEPARTEPAATAVAATPPSQPKPLKPTTTRPATPPVEEEELEEEEEAPLTADMILARQIYHSMLLRHTFKHIRYPKRAQDRGQEGSVRLNVTIDNRGNVTSVTTVQESRYSSLNREALEAVERAGPYPATPVQLKMEEYRFSVPITFRLPD
ncbi:energy transducer TonB [Microbulbifer agarilyticus]|uniref:Energy transducer TonB n=1 Tax=Microbulbifer agarilyticus TaxID=260552 RepID=A0A1Q2MAA7_9GAMM|nr:TonB family protein [Microbulbifer agarilyticus]AQQ69600.1 energy transducer TonB [Microbulbifer agarilyticus]